MQKILIIQTAFLGDVVLATPLIENLHRQFPNAVIDLMVRKGNEGLLQNHPIIRKLYTFDKKNKWSSILRNLSEIRREKYDLAINLQRFASSGLITFLSGAKEKRGFKANPFSWCYSAKFPHDTKHGQHEVDRNLQMISKEIQNPNRIPKLYPSTEDFSHVNQFKTTSYFCLAPSSVWFTKAAPKEVWVTLTNQLREKGTIYFLGGPADIPLIEEIITQTGRNQVQNLAGELTLLQSAALMRDATRNYVNDSGPLHLASAMNAKVTAFFCSTVPSFGFGPLSDDQEIIEITELSCRPCGLHGHKACPKGHFQCGKQLVDVLKNKFQN